jgi:hypothetical protein
MFLLARDFGIDAFTPILRLAHGRLAGGSPLRRR